MTDARHDQAVAMLTSSGNEVTLVVYREKLVEKDSQQPVYQRKSILEVPKAKPLTLDETVAPIVEEPEPAGKLQSGPVLRGPLLKTASVVSSPSVTPKTDSSSVVFSKPSQPISSISTSPKKLPPPIASKPVLSQMGLSKTTPSAPHVSHVASSTCSVPSTHTTNVNSARTYFLQSTNAVPPSVSSGGSLVEKFNNLARQQNKTNTNTGGSSSSPVRTLPTANNALISHNSLQDSKSLQDKGKSPTRLLKQDSPPIEVLNA